MMKIYGAFDYLPLWGVFVTTVALVLISVEVGFWLGSFRYRHSDAARQAPLGDIVGAMLGLLALMLAFTFDLAASRFETRRTLVLKEANAIGTTYLRAGLLPEPQRTEIRKLLHEYVELRLAAVRASDIEQAVARSEDLHRQLWAQTVAVGKKSPDSIVVGLFIGSLNEMIDLHASRVTLGLRNRLPRSIWAVLCLVTMIAAGTIGYHAGLVGARKLSAILPLVITYAVILWLIADLDRSQEGLLRVSQQAMIDARDTIERGMP